MEVDVAVVVVVHVLEPRQVEVRQSWVRPLVLVHVLVKLPTPRRPPDHARIDTKLVWCLYIQYYMSAVCISSVKSSSRGDYYCSAVVNTLPSLTAPLLKYIPMLRNQQIVVLLWDSVVFFGQETRVTTEQS